MNTPLFDQLYELLLAANAHTNLTRLTSPEDFANRHVQDSLTLLPWIPEKSRLIDLGSGAGFPALPLAIERPDIHVTAVESVGKKCRFIEETAQALGLTNVTVINDRAEALGREAAYREQYNVVTARALAALPVLLEYAMPLVSYPDGCFIAFKGPQYVAELAEAQTAVMTLKTKLSDVIVSEQPELQGSTLLRFIKTGPMPAAYPRAVGVPAKKPL